MGRPTQQKRQRERARQEQRKLKDARRLEAKERRQQVSTQTSAGGDPDLDGIVAGPQPLAEWQVEGLATFEEADEAAEEPGQNG